MSIPILDLSPEIEAHWTEFNDAIQGVLKSGQFIMGPAVKAFESEVAAYLGVKHAVGLNSGTDALVIGLRALEIRPGDEVITTAFTFFATAEAISALGATPVFVDIDPKTFNIDPAQIEAKITPRTRAILPVHLYGNAADMDRITAIAKKHNLRVLEDCAQSMGGEYHGKKLGTLSDVGAFSFFPSKNLGGFGDGGLLVTKDETVADTARMLRTHGSKRKYYNEAIGYNSRLDEIQAACLRVKLKYLDKANEGRRQSARRYAEILQDIPGVITPSEAAQAKHVYHQYTIRITAGNRDQLQKRLAEAGVSTMLYYPVPLHKLRMYESMRLSLPVTDKASHEVLSLPIWPEIRPETQIEVAAALKKALEDNGQR